MLTAKPLWGRPSHDSLTRGNSPVWWCIRIWLPRGRRIARSISIGGGYLQPRGVRAAQGYRAYKWWSHAGSPKESGSPGSPNWPHLSCFFAHHLGYPLLLPAREHSPSTKTQLKRYLLSHVLSCPAPFIQASLYLATVKTAQHWQAAAITPFHHHPGIRTEESAGNSVTLSAVPLPVCWALHCGFW